MDKQLTDEEIIMALECCIKDTNCDGCPLENKNSYNECEKSFLDCIKSQKAEIDRLNARIGVYETCNARKDESIKDLESQIKIAKSEAYKEFAERLKNRTHEISYNTQQVVSIIQTRQRRCKSFDRKI